MADDPTDLTQHPVPSRSLVVLNRNLEDLDSVINTPGPVINRVGNEIVISGGGGGGNVQVLNDGNQVVAAATGLDFADGLTAAVSPDSPSRVLITAPAPATPPPDATPGGNFDDVTGTPGQELPDIDDGQGGTTPGGIVVDGQVRTDSDGREYHLVVAPPANRVQTTWGLFGLDTTLPNGLSGDAMEHSETLASTYATFDDSANGPITSSIGPAAVLNATNLGDGWYLPAPDEVQAAFDNRAQIDGSATGPGTFAQMEADGQEQAWLPYEDSATQAWYKNLTGNQSNQRRNKSDEDFAYSIPVRRIYNDAVPGTSVTLTSNTAIFEGGYAVVWGAVTVPANEALVVDYPDGFELGAIGPPLVSHISGVTLGSISLVGNPSATSITLAHTHSAPIAMGYRVEGFIASS